MAKMDFEIYLRALRAKIEITDEIVYEILSDREKIKQINRDCYSSDVLIGVCNK